MLDRLAGVIARVAIEIVGPRAMWESLIRYNTARRIEVNISYTSAPTDDDDGEDDGAPPSKLDPRIWGNVS